MNQSWDEQRQQMCEIGQRIWQREYCAGNEGNLSIRLNSDRVLCTPTGISKGFMQPADLCVIDLAGNEAEPNANGRTRTSEILAHLAIYQALPGIGSVVHAHPPHAVAFCITRQPLPEGIHPEAEIFLGRSVFADYATPGSPDVPASFISKLTDHTNTILLANHGSISLGKDLTEAYYRLEILDSYCHQLLLARQLGQPHVLSDEQMTELLRIKKQFGMTDDR